ncbi:MAG: phage Gp37/Gp68 family protein [Bacteroidetes bacterium]|nr:phage Gp37/Gp68 family protein [Bacteroidota bacterium]
MAETKIEWTELTWNPATGCTKISSGCRHCYAEKMAGRLQAMGIDKYRDGFELRWHESELFRPYHWKQPRMVFVNSMSDLFHEGMPLEFIQQVFQVMNDCPQHVFQVLTKRTDILRQYSPLLNWSSNIWMGVTVEGSSYTDRIHDLQAVGAFIKFLSLEPLLTPLPDLDLLGIGWVIVGGESGNKVRPLKKEWVVDIRNQCQAAEVPFFFKQWGGRNKKAAGCLLDGMVYKEMPNLEVLLPT